MCELVCVFRIKCIMQLYDCTIVDFSKLNEFYKNITLSSLYPCSLAMKLASAPLSSGNYVKVESIRYIMFSRL